jgi:hypothetical protein
MTRHSLHNIASIVSRAGFTGNAVAEAVALAMHASSGDDAYDYLACVDPLIHERGLFAISVDAYKPEDQHKLFDPYFSAQELFKDYSANKYSWDGHRAQKFALTPENVREIRAAINSRTPTMPIDQPSKMAQVAYSQRL